MRNLLVTLLLVGACGCVPTPVKQALDHGATSLKSLETQVDVAFKPGVQALQREQEAASNLAGKPAVALTPIVFARDAAGQALPTQDQAGVAQANALVGQLQQKLAQREALLGTLDTLVKLGGSLLGGTGLTIAGLYFSLRKRKNQVQALLEGAQDSIGKLAELPGKLKDKDAGEILAELANVPEIVKGTLKEYQDARNVWQGLKADMAKVKEDFTVGNRTAKAIAG